MNAGERPKCTACGESAAEGARFCGACGARLEAQTGGDAADPLVGRTLAGTYLVQHRIGGGGMGEVYRAIHVQLEFPVALKIVRRELVAHPAMIHRFQREARAASRLRHPNVVAVTDFGHADGTLYMVMEYVAGKSLARVIAREAPLSERRVVHIGAQILSALAEAHANGVLHRDLKPDNVMLEARRDAPDTVKVLDFGIAKILSEAEAASTLTQAGLVCGTPGYMSPEQLRGGPLDARSDLFSVGVVLYEMLTHALPFDVPTPMEMLHKHLSESIPPPSTRSSRRISPGLEDVVMQALSPAQGDRAESAVAMRDQLLRSLGASRDTRTPARGTGSGAPAGAGPRGSDSGSPAAGVATPQPLPASARATPVAQRTSSPRTASVRATTWDPAVLERAARELAPYLGPVARLIVVRASGRARSVGELYELLAREIPSEAEREQFRRIAPPHAR